MSKLLTLLLTVVGVLGIVLAGCRQATPTPAATPTMEEVTIPPVASPTIPLPQPTSTPLTPPTEVATPPVTPVTPVVVVPRARPAFAQYTLAPVNVVPAVVHAPIAADLSNVDVPFVLSAEQIARLGQSGVVVSPGVEKEFFTVYEKLRYSNLPAFVSSDSLLHVYHLLFDKTLRSAETQAFIPLLRDLNAAMLAQTTADYKALKDTPWADAALRAVAFVGVGSQLLDPTITVPDYARELVSAEVNLVNTAAGIQPSPLFPGLTYGEDYTQYIPRGHYTRSEALSAYFKSMMWYGRMTFRLKPEEVEVGRAETRTALLLVNALRQAQLNGRPALDAWLDLYNPTVFFVGRSDDLTAFQYLDVMDAIYGAQPAPLTLVDENKLSVFIESADQLPPPRILGLVISVDQDEAATTKGFRFMGQRFVPDAYIFRQLIYRHVGDNQNPRLLPKGLDVLAAIGSERAYTLLDQMGETQYLNYPAQMQAMRDWTASLSVNDWTETLYTTWLYTFMPLLTPTDGEGYPQFMRSEAWLDKQLNTSLGSWTELKHDTLLYAKQVYAELGGGGSNAPQPRLLNGYVEPVPEFFARLAGLTDMTLQGLNSRGLLSEQDGASLQRLHDLAVSFQIMAEKELRGEPLTEEEYYLIRFYGGELEHLTMAAADTEGEGSIPVLDEEPQAAVVADVATAPDYPPLGGPAVLEEGIGRINEIYVVAPLTNEDGTITLQVVKGGVFAYHEFAWPANDRLTDEKWRALLDAGQAPPIPAWTASFFTPETEFADLQRTIYSYQADLSQVYWNLSAEYQPAVVTEAVRQMLSAEVGALRAAQQYVGRQWLNASYRSFDRQSPTLAVVTVRETWQDTLYSFKGDCYGDCDTQQQVEGQRGPYTLDVTYSLTASPDSYTGWYVSQVVIANQPPAWTP